MFSELMMRSTASAKSSQTANGGGVIEVSSPAQYFPRERRDQVNYKVGLASLLPRQSG